MTSPYDVRLTIGLTKSSLVGFRADHPYNKKAKISWSSFIDQLRFHPDGYQFMPKFQNGVWDGYYYLFTNGKKGEILFPVGLSKKVSDYFTTRGVTVVWKFAYTWSCPMKITPIPDLKLRKYQRQATLEALHKLRGIIKAPTGSGKTKIGTSIIRSVNAQTLWLTDKRDLLYQTRDSLRKDLKVPIGIVGDGKRQFESITVASVRTILKHEKEFRRTINHNVCLIGDEIHHATSNEWFNVMKRIPGVYRFGLTATPIKGAKFIKLEAVTGPIIYDAKSSKLVKQGYLSKPYIFVLKYKKKPIADMADLQQAIRKGIVLNKRRTKLIVEIVLFLCRIPGMNPVAIQVRKIKHLQMIEKRLKKTNLKYISISGKDSSKKRQETYKKVETDKIDVVLVSRIFDEGIDIKNLRVVLRCSEGKSWHNTIQVLGRGMRTADDKRSVIVVDFFDESHEYLERHSRARVRSYKSEGHEVKICDLPRFKKEILRLIKQQKLF